tara:strand:+ start:11887 stop:13494 length:1608 start_codon:yes stop_codon:yes gene_type:complete
MTTPNQAASAGDISKLLIFSKKGNDSKDVSAGVVHCDYFESILEPTIRFEVLITDSGHESGSDEAVSAIESLKLSGSEKVNLQIADAYGNSMRFEGDNALYIGEVKNIMSSESSVIYTLVLVSREAIANELRACEIYKRFDGEISATVSTIIKDVLKSEKNILLDNTSNKLNVIGQAKKPFRLIGELATKGVPKGSENTAGYLFYETYDGYNFRSIDNLFDDTEGTKSYIYNNNFDGPAGYDAKIIRYDAETTINVDKNLKSGAYGSALETSDTYTQTFQTAKEIDTTEQKVHGGTEVAGLNEEFTNIFQSIVSKTFFRRDNIGFLQSGSPEEQVANATEQNEKIQDAVVQAAMTYNKLFSLDVTIAVPGDYGLRAGHVVHCDFPAKDSKGVKGDEFDKELSGLYIVADICTRLTPDSTVTKMRLVRDSYGRQPNKSSATKGVANTGRSGLFGSNSTNPFSDIANSDEALAKLVTQQELDFVNKWNSGTWEAESTSPGGTVVDKTPVGGSSNTSVDLDAGYDDPNFNPDDYLELY